MRKIYIAMCLIMVSNVAVALDKKNCDQILEEKYYQLQEEEANEIIQIHKRMAIKKYPNDPDMQELYFRDEFKKFMELKERVKPFLPEIKRIIEKSMKEQEPQK